MKKCMTIIFAVLFCFLGANILYAAADTWTQKADVGTQRDILPSVSPLGARTT